ncbi:MAG: beta-propeller fold lactonase family protein [Acidobacteriota bacterium]|nr:beta-propeller fold lactonase family protein [Acidobacteriota bacterium]
MKFMKFGKTLWMSALSLGAILGVTSCVQSYTVGFLYVTGTVTADSTGNGIISGFKIDHNTGRLIRINGLPVSSGGSNPERALMIQAGKFLYVLNRGTNASGGSVCTSSDPCQGANITQFAVGGNGILTPQQTFYTQGINPFRMVADSSGTFIYVLDHDAPDTAACALVFGSSTTSCGDITAFQVDPVTGRLSLVVNAQVTAANGSALTYFPIPANPIDFNFANNYLLTLFGTPATGDYVFPYTRGGGGQLSVNQNSSQPLNIKQATALVYSSFVYVLDNEPITYTPQGASSPVTSPSQILPYTIGSNGALQSQTGGAVPDDPSLSNPIYLISAGGTGGGKWVYVLNQGDNSNTNVQQSGIAGYVIDSSTRQLTTMSGSPFGTGGGPRCIVEDPSSQFIYTANYNDSSVTGRLLDQNVGNLDALPGKANQQYALDGPPTWCVVSGRTN